tara:strand:+ start:14630 stop:14962 length:333 start_codon:yes stop_codon:yes gene_type:complete
MKFFCKKPILIFSAVAFLSACTPEIEYALQKEWKAIKKYDVAETVSVATGFRDAFPHNYAKMVEQDRNLCLHEDAHDREITVNGINDMASYRFCTLTPAEAPVPSRFNGR